MIEDKYIVFAHVKDDEYPMCMTIKALSVLESAYGSVDNIFGVAKEATKTGRVADLAKAALTIAPVLADAGRTMCGRWRQNPTIRNFRTWRRACRTSLLLRNWKRA